MVVGEKADEAGASPGPTPPAPPGRPFWPVALLLLGLIVAVLGAAYALDQRFRPRVGTESAPTAQVVVQPTVSAAVQPTAVPTAAAPATPSSVPATASPVPTAATVPAPTLTSAPTPVPTRATALPPSSQIAATAAPTPAGGVAVAIAVDSTVGTPGATGPIVRRTIGPELERLSPPEREVATAYLHYWDVRVRAYYDLDTSHLTEVMADAELAREEQNIRELQAQGRIGLWDVDLTFRVVMVSPGEALVSEEYVNRSVYVDAVTKARAPRKEPRLFKLAFQLRKLDGTWKVVDGTRRE